MKVDFLKELGLSDEQISKIQAESGKDVQKEKDKATAIQTKLDEANEQIKALNETIKGSEGDAQKLKDLQDKVQSRSRPEESRRSGSQGGRHQGKMRWSERRKQVPERGH